MGLSAIPIRAGACFLLCLAEGAAIAGGVQVRAGSLIMENTI